MEKHRIFLSWFFAKLTILIGFLAVGCTSREVVDPMEKTSEEGEAEFYFWGGMNGDEKIYLNLDPLRRLYRLENAGDAEDVISNMKSRSEEFDIQVMLIGEYSYLLVSKATASASFPNPVSEKIKFQVPVYTTKRTGFTYLFDGIIMLKPKEGTSIEEILKREPETKLVKSLVGGIHFLSVEDGEKILTIANRIYESGLVQACHPSYLAPIVKHHIPTDAHYHHQYYLNNTGQSGGTPGIDIKAQGGLE